MKKIFLYDDIDSSSLAFIDSALNEIDAGEDIELNIMSYGGSACDGIAIAERLLEAPQRITARVIGCAMSAAAIVACACDRIVMSDYGALMIHSCRNLFGEIDEGSRVINRNFLKIINRRLPEYSEADLEDDRFFTAEAALKIGLIDEVLTVEPDRAKLVARWAAHIRSFGGKTMDEEKKAPESVQEELEVAADENPTQAILDGIAAILERLDAIESKLHNNEVSNECDEPKECPDDKLTASVRKIYAQIGRVCVPVAQPSAAPVSTPETDKARLEKIYGNFSRFGE